MNFIGLNIKKIREYWGLSQDEFGWLVGASRGMIMQYERRGSKPKDVTVSKIVRLTGIASDMLLNSELLEEDMPEFKQEDAIALDNYRLDPDSFPAVDDFKELLNTGHKKKERNDGGDITIKLSEIL